VSLSHTKRPWKNKSSLPKSRAFILGMITGSENVFDETLPRRKICLRYPKMAAVPLTVTDAAPMRRARRRQRWCSIFTAVAVAVAVAVAAHVCHSAVAVTAACAGREMSPNSSAQSREGSAGLLRKRLRRTPAAGRGRGRRHLTEFAAEDLFQQHPAQDAAAKSPSSGSSPLPPSHYDDLRLRDDVSAETREGSSVMRITMPQVQAGLKNDEGELHFTQAESPPLKMM